ncbi:MAG: TIM barrel protein [Planctomycetota bacterium]|nr:TIM barrel protein [Planctomycetota bacterium]
MNEPTNRRTFLAGSAALTGAALTLPALAQPAGEQGGAARAAGAAPKSNRPLDGVKTNFACNIEMWGFGTGDHSERIRKAADLGFRAVEFWPWRGKDIDAIDKARRDTKLQVIQFVGWGFTPGMNDPANHDAFVKEIEAGIETANRLDTKMMLVLAGNDIPGKTKEQMHQGVIDGFKRVAPIVEKAGITLILEPLNLRVDHRGYCLNKSADAVRICKAVGSKNVKICWDLYHLQIDEGDLCGNMRDGYSEIAYFQFADHPGRNDPGTGEVHYERVFRAARDLGYTGWFGTEFSPLEGERKAAERVAATDPA